MRMRTCRQQCGTNLHNRKHKRLAKQSRTQGNLGKGRLDFLCVASVPSGQGFPRSGSISDGKSSDASLTLPCMDTRLFRQTRSHVSS